MANSLIPGLCTCADRIKKDFGFSPITIVQKEKNLQKIKTLPPYFSGRDCSDKSECTALLKNDPQKFLKTISARASAGARSERGPLHRAKRSQTAKRWNPG